MSKRHAPAPVRLTPRGTAVVTALGLLAFLALWGVGGWVESWGVAT